MTRKILISNIAIFWPKQPLEPPEKGIDVAAFGSKTPLALSQRPG
jgi:hypothetical protein